VLLSDNSDTLCNSLITKKCKNIIVRVFKLEIAGKIQLLEELEDKAIFCSLAMMAYKQVWL
jgi:hypothetical protein